MKLQVICGGGTRHEQPPSAKSIRELAGAIAALKVDDACALVAEHRLMEHLSPLALSTVAGHLIRFGTPAEHVERILH